MERNKIDKAKIVLILTTIYLIIYALTGLKVGYQRTPYSLKAIEIIKNFFTIFAFSILLEIIRTTLIKHSKSVFSFILITIVLFLAKVQYQNFSSAILLEDLLEYLLGEFLTSFIESILLSYLSKSGGFILNFAYSVPIALSKILLPVFPDLNWFLNASIKYILYLLILLFTKYEDTNLIRKSKRQIRKENPAKAIPAILAILLIVMFVAGFLPYKPVAVVSNSMSPYFNRGDICIIKKITDYKQIKELQEGDVVEYQQNNIFILHRIVDIKETANGYKYETKGDNNKDTDLLPVDENQVVGKVTYVVPYLGFPSVWFSEWIHKNK